MGGGASKQLQKENETAKLEIAKLKEEKAASDKKLSDAMSEIVELKTPRDPVKAKLWNPPDPVSSYDSVSNLKGKKILITGCDRGIGLEMTKHLTEKCGAEVIAVSHSDPPSAELEDIDCYKVIAGVDITKADGMMILREKLDSEIVDVLVNNAGVLSHAENSLGLEQISQGVDGACEKYQIEMATNAIGHLRVTASILDKLASPGGKIFFTSSNMGSMTDMAAGGAYGYRASKAALNAVAKAMSLELKPKGITVCIINPGLVDTDMARPFPAAGKIALPECARKYIQYINDSTEANSGNWMDVNTGELVNF
mmetsp:Transcript_36196/g.56526  ORF Transcript_36196/g.56526 Transcript_36196/m.56526 type:complete len:312 (+) Transcript_36196:95-1030(+)